MPRWSGQVQVEMRAWQRSLYAFIRVVVGGFCRLFWRTQVEGLENIPAAGPFILSPVHRSNIDTPLVSVMGKRRVRFLGKDSMWKFRFSDWFFTSMGGIPVHRGVPDRAAMKSCDEVLGSGQPMVIFPEGTRKSGPVIEEIFEGPAYLAAKHQVPIVPVGIGGSEGAMPKGAKMIKPVKLHVVIGRPISPPAPTESGRVGRKGVKALSDDLKERLQELFDDAQTKAHAR